MTEPAISIEGVGKRFRRFKERPTSIKERVIRFRTRGENFWALRDVTVEVPEGQTLGLLGPNGSGKTTLALLLGGLLRPAGGSVTGVDRQPIWRLPARQLAGRIGSVFQDPEHQFLTGSVKDELTLAPERDGLPAAEAASRAAVLMERLRLTPLAEANPFTLSGGEKRRLSVATALVTEPSVLILDEPTFGQDRRTAVELLDLLSGQRDTGTAICFVTHDLPFANALADRRLAMPR